MPTNRDMQIAAASKKDEFYTQYVDIEKELCHYQNHFKGKTVFCNCDDAFNSNFFRYFVNNFNRLGLKRLISTCFSGSLRNNSRTKPYSASVKSVPAARIGVRKLLALPGNSLDTLKGDGDFRSRESIELLKVSDIIVTNPPFSLFREYIRILLDYEKKFLIIGNVNAITYKEFFPMLMHDKVWIGHSIHSGDRKFYVPDNYPLEAAGCGIDSESGRKYIMVKGVRWFTNLEISERHKFMNLQARYSEDMYPFYDNYNAIEVKHTRKIPGDYPGVMGVPVTFFDKYNPEQFQIIGADFQVKTGLLPFMIRQGWYGKIDRGYINGKRQYARILIKNRNPVICGSGITMETRNVFTQASLFA